MPGNLSGWHISFLGILLVYIYFHNGIDGANYVVAVAVVVTVVNVANVIDIANYKFNHME